MDKKITSDQVKEKLYKLYSRNVVDEKTFQEILSKLNQEHNYEEKFYGELLKRLNERLDFKLERGMLEFLEKNLK